MRYLEAGHARGKAVVIIESVRGTQSVVVC